MADFPYECVGCVGCEVCRGSVKPYRVIDRTHCWGIFFYCDESLKKMRAREYVCVELPLDAPEVSAAWAAELAGRARAAEEEREGRAEK